MPKQTRKQKKRNVNDATIQIKQLTNYYTSIVNTHYTFKEWIEAMEVDCEDNIELQKILYAFIAQSMVYLHIFMAEYEGKRVVVIDKQDFIKSIKDQTVYDTLTYTEEFTKEKVMSFLDKCIDKFFTNTLFPVYENKDLEKVGE